MKPIIFLCTLLLASQTFAGTQIAAKLVKDNTYLSLRLVDDQLLPPFGAGVLWNSLRERQQIKRISEREFNLQCEGRPVPSGDVYGDCSLLIPIDQFKKIKNKLVFKAEGELADKLNHYFNDSAYVSIENDLVYLSAFNTRRQFFFGITESIIH